MIHVHNNPLALFPVPDRLPAPKDPTLALHQKFADQLSALARTASPQLQGHCLLGGLSGVDEDSIRSLIGLAPKSTEGFQCLHGYLIELGEHLSHGSCGRGHSGRIQQLLVETLRFSRNDTFNRGGTVDLPEANRAHRINNHPQINNVPGVNNLPGVNNVPGINNASEINNVTQLNNVSGISNVVQPVFQSRDLAEEHTLVLRDNRREDDRGDKGNGRSNPNESVDVLMNHQG